VTALPRVTSDRICCPSCGQPAPFLPTGNPDWHLTGGAVCLAVWPPYVDGAPQPMRRRPVVHQIGRRRR
jgi:hypothetical protein